MDELVRISDLARILASGFPGDSANLIRERVQHAICKAVNDELHPPSHWLDEERTHRHNVKELRGLCDEWRQQMDELVLLCRKHLPELRLRWVRLNPPWRYDDADLDWAPIVEELHQIEDAALTMQLTAKPAKQSSGKTGTANAPRSAKVKKIIRCFQRGMTDRQLIAQACSCGVNDVSQAKRRYADACKPSQKSDTT